MFTLVFYCEKKLTYVWNFIYFGKTYQRLRAPKLIYSGLDSLTSGDTRSVYYIRTIWFTYYRKKCFTVIKKIYDQTELFQCMDTPPPPPSLPDHTCLFIQCAAYLVVDYAFASIQCLTVFYRWCMKIMMHNNIIDEVPTCSNSELFNKRAREWNDSYRPLFERQELFLYTL